MSRHRIVTRNSVWFVDLDAHILTRIPRNEAPVHPTLPYEKVGSPRHFDTVERQPWRDTHFYHFTDGLYWFETGEVEEDDMPEELPDGRGDSALDSA